MPVRCANVGAAAIALWVVLGLTIPGRASAEYARGRVRLSNKTIVSDWGTMLRGCYWNPDVNGGKLPNRADLAGIKSCGLNALHLWAECYWQKQAGQNAATVDSCVKWCREDSLYCVICYGGCDANNNFFLDQLKAFWNFYAPRYKDETHVVYEIQNEPAKNTEAFHDSVIDMNRECYQIIRSHAPETHVLFFSYCCLYDGANAIGRDVERLGPDIDWTNASVAFHGYFVKADTQATYIRTLSAQGIPLTCTEFPGGCNSQYNRFNEILARTYEAEGVSYLHFCPLTTARTEVQKVVSSGVTWQPDFGDWPQPHVDRTVGVRGSAAAPAPRGRSPLAPLLVVPGFPAEISRYRAVYEVYDLSGKLVARQHPAAYVGPDNRPVDVLSRAVPKVFVVRCSSD
jgi:hypothetical protein